MHAGNLWTVVHWGAFLSTQQFQCMKTCLGALFHTLSFWDIFRCKLVCKHACTHTYMHAHTYAEAQAFCEVFIITEANKVLTTTTGMCGLARVRECRANASCCGVGESEKRSTIALLMFLHASLNACLSTCPNPDQHAVRIMTGVVWFILIN